MATSIDSRLFISWEPSNTRSNTLAEQFSASCHHIHYLALKKPWVAPFKYLLQSVKTWAVLRRHRPSVVFVQNPPPFAALAVWGYCALADCAFILDSHTGVFLERKWRWLSFLHAFLVRRALVSIVTNEHLGRMVRDWGGEYFVFPDVPTEFPEAEKIRDKPQTLVTVVNSFSYDEPTEEVLKAAAMLPQVDFLVTGDLGRCPKALRQEAPENVRFTGFLTRKDYVDTVFSSDAVIVLTTEDFTMQRGAYEAMSMGVPVVTSDWPILKETFFKGTAHTDNTAESIATKLAEVLANLDEYRASILDLKQRRRDIWSNRLAEFSKAYLRSASMSDCREPF